MTFIYALRDPRTRNIRYIGKANDPARRLRQHLNESARRQTHLGKWLRSLSQTPEIVILSQVPESVWQEVESAYIRAAKEAGLRLVNATDGGEGLHNPSPETRQKMSASKRGSLCHWFGKRRSEAERAKIGAAKLGCKNPNFGKHPSQETRDKQSKAHLGKKFSPLHRSRLSRSIKRWWKLQNESRN